jgi:Xaa-Pro dipeptidase
MKPLVEYKYKRIKNIMSENGIDILIASSPGNILYMSGYKSHKIANAAQQYFLYNGENDKKAIITPLASMPTILDTTIKDIEIYCYGEFYFAFNENEKSLNYKNLKNIITKNSPSADDALLEAIYNIGSSKQRYGIDENYMKPKTWDAIISNFPGIKLYPSAGLLSEIRKIKHPDEILLLEHSAEITEESLYEVIKYIEIGLSEKEIGNRFNTEICKKGGLPYFSIVTVDDRSAYSDTINTNKTINDGSIVRFDVGCVYEGYCSDMARTLVIGNYDKRYKEYYKYLLEGEEAAINKIRPGVFAKDIFEVAMKTVRKGIPHYNRHHCGHGIGIEGYNPPLIAPNSKEILEVGMVLCIETPYYEIGWGGLQVEDTLVIEEAGSRYLTKSSKKLIEK